MDGWKDGRTDGLNDGQREQYTPNKHSLQGGGGV